MMANDGRYGEFVLYWGVDSCAYNFVGACADSIDCCLSAIS